MRKRTLPQNKSNKRHKRESNSIPWRYGLMTLFFGLILVVGFFLAARQHFSSIEFGMKNSKLRRQIDELESEKRRLILEKEIALSPSEIKKAAKKIGLTTMTASNIEVYRNNGQSGVKSPTDKNAATKPSEKPEAETKPAQPSANKADDKPAKPDKPAKTEKKASDAKKTSDQKEKTQAKTVK